ncbi:unnamed protein product, partial [Anisakis simplex]|uniref:Glycosyl transferase family 2 n=1 Tax=Anisakis simplex TaxID=6269 RepID=A0A0M3J9K5_ANISI
RFQGDIPSQVAVQEIIDQVDDSVDQDAQKTTKKRKYFIGSEHIGVPRINTEIETFMKDGMIEDWDMFEKMVDYAYANVFFAESKYQPVLFSECAWNAKQKREKLMELMFEKYNVPAFFLVKNAVLA